MPKAAAPRKVTAPVDATVKFKTINRARNKAGRATASNVKTTLELLPLEPAPPPSVLPDHIPQDPESDVEEKIQLKTQKNTSKAVSVSLESPYGVSSG